MQKIITNNTERIESGPLQIREVDDLHPMDIDELLEQLGEVISGV